LSDLNFARLFARASSRFREFALAGRMGAFEIDDVAGRVGFLPLSGLKDDLDRVD
jgi:hypothetical protein